MIKTECPKCKAELIQHDGYGVCSKCGEIVGYEVCEEPEEIIEEILTPPQPAEEIVPEELEEIPEEVIETEDIIEETVEEEIAIAEEVEKIKESVITGETEKPKKKKTPIVVLIIVVLCILALLGGYFITKVNRGIVDNETEDVTQEDIIEEEPKAIVEESEEVQIQQEVEKEEVIPEPKPEPVKKDTPKKQTVKKEDAVISPTPSISYRIRRTADDSDTQIGAFSDIERAKAFASTHSADGYKVYDMNGNVVFEP